MNPRLILSYDFSRDDDFGWLEMAIQTPDFSGRGGFWVQWQEVEEWIPSLMAYPLAAPSERSWGYGESNGEYRAVVDIRIAPANAVGDLEIYASVCDHLEQRNRCEALFQTNYLELEAFATGLKNVMGRTGEEAILNGRVRG